VLNLVDKELSWLAFNERVLQEAENPSTPLIQRVRFLGIYSSNRDEFYRVRVADVRRLANLTSGGKKQQYDDLLHRINERVLKMQKRFDDCYRQMMKELAKNRIYLVDETQLTETQLESVVDYFNDQIANYLDPFFIDEFAELPTLNDASIYFAIELRLSDDSMRYGAVSIPSNRLPRFIKIPPRNGKRETVFIVLDNIIRTCLPLIFRGLLDIQSARAFTFKISRDAELELGEGITQNHIDRVSSSLRRRTQADAVRFVHDRAMPEELVGMITRKLKMGKYDSYTPGGRYHNAKDFISFPNVGPARFLYPSLKPIKFQTHGHHIFDAIQQRDIMLYYPYHDFHTVIDLLCTAAIDPQVKSIHISLYRVASDSLVAAALINAVRNRKEVTAVVELQARFDEQANISWAQKLTAAGVNVIFGVPGLKVHSKIISIVRQEAGTPRYYSHVGTGNFNEKTANLYCDISLFTANQEIGRDVAHVFDFIKHNYKRHHFKHISVSPYNNRPTLIEAIDREIEWARQGKTAKIQLKCNNLVDTEVVTKLYEASAAGVEVQLIIRSMCTLVPEQPGRSENIKAISIVDKYLEHARIYIFHNNGDPRYMISSADLMTRNLDYRVEVTCPIYDTGHQAFLQELFNIQWRDNVKARSLANDQSNKIANQERKRKVRSQDALQRFIARQTGQNALQLPEDTDA
jgi:polyphosphate kinase